MVTAPILGLLPWFCFPWYPILLAVYHLTLHLHTIHKSRHSTSILSISPPQISIHHPFMISLSISLRKSHSFLVKQEQTTICWVFSSNKHGKHRGFFCFPTVTLRANPSVCPRRRRRHVRTSKNTVFCGTKCTCPWSWLSSCNAQLSYLCVECYNNNIIIPIECKV